MLSRTRFRLPLLALVCSLSWNVAQADIIVLKSGERFEGRLLNENDTSVTIEYYLTKKIKDSKVINKADIKEHTRQTEAMIEIEEKGLRKILPTADLLSAAEYESIIQDRLRTFTAKHPGTPETAEVEKIILALSEEKEKVQDGQVKMEGKWLDSAAAKRDSYEIEAYRTRLAMKRAAAQLVEARNVNALREFDQLRKDFPASLQFVAAIPEALVILDAYDQQLATMVREQPILAKQRQDGLALLSGSDQQVTKASIEAEERSFKATSDAQFKAKVKWRDIYRYDLKGLQEALAAVAKERSELMAMDLATLLSENTLLTAAIRLLADGKPTEAAAELAKISKSQQLNKVAYLAVDKQIKKAVDDEKKLKARTVAAPVTETPKEDKPDQEMAANPVAEAMKKLQEEKDKKKAAAADAAAAKEKAAKDGADKPATPRPAAADEGFAAKFNEYIPFIGGGLLVILLAAIFLGKKKNKEE